MPPNLIVLSHLRWDLASRRPQHLLSRLERHHRVLFIEKPVRHDGAPQLERVDAADNVTLLRPSGFHADQPGVLDRLMAEAVSEDPGVVWFCPPTALPLLSSLCPRAVIYDCADELATSEHADTARFAPSRITANCKEYLAAERLQGRILAPRLGFLGAIDERLDLALVAAIADTHPNWHVVMAGPVMLGDRAPLPQRPNIRWLGEQPCSRLPALVAGWDVCLLPFALDGHTRFVSPARTLEYLAAEKPVVSTAVAGVAGLCGDVVRVGYGHAGFIAHCARALEETPQRRDDRLAQSAACMSRFSWDETARTVLRLTEDPPAPPEPSIANPAASRGVRSLAIGAAA